MRTQIVVLSLISILFFLPAPSFGLSYHQAQLSACAGRAMDQDTEGPAFSLTGDLQFLLTTDPGTFNLCNIRVQAIQADEYSSGSSEYGIQSLFTALSITNSVPSMTNRVGFGIQADLGVSRVTREYHVWIESGNPSTYSLETRKDNNDFAHAMFGVHLIAVFNDRADGRAELALGKAMGTMCYQARAFVDFELTRHLVLSVQGMINYPKDYHKATPIVGFDWQYLSFHNSGSERYTFLLAGLGYRF